MAPVPVFHGTVTSEAVLVLERSEAVKRKNYLRYLRGKPVEVVIRRVRRQRSNQQNKYIHAVVAPIMAEYQGQGIGETKLDLMGECWGWRESKITGKPMPLKPHTHEMSVEESTHFIDWVIPWAMTEHGVDIPPPRNVEYGE